MFDKKGAAVLHFQTIHIDHQLGVTCPFVFGSLENMMVQYVLGKSRGNSPDGWLSEVWVVLH
jgi:hypothetical protein